MSTAKEVIEVPQAWWQAFISEPIVDDASDNPEDELLRQTWRLLQLTPTSETKRVRRINADERIKWVLWKHATWYAYYWGENATEAWDDGERMSWLAKACSSAAFARRLGVAG